MEYLIKKGNHYASGLHLGVHFGITTQKYRVKFSKECLYTPDWENDWNKLCGWSYGLHHKNSIRVAWRPEVKDSKVTGKVELAIYVYENSIRKISESTITVTVDEIITLDIWYKPGSRSIVVDDGWDKMEIYYTIKPSWGYRLFPYIGGTNVATVDTRIELERL